MANPFRTLPPLNGIPVACIDTEFSFQMKGGKTDPSPYDPNNTLVSAAYKWVYPDGNHVSIITDNICFYHEEEPYTPNGPEQLQKVIDDSSLLVFHHAKGDLEVLAENGFKVDKPVYCTQIGEFVLLKSGFNESLSLNECLKRHDLGEKSTLVDQYFKDGVSPERIPWSILSEYGVDDVEKLFLLFEYQIRELQLTHGVDVLAELMTCYTLEDLEGTAQDLLEQLDKQGATTNDSNDERNDAGSSGDTA